MFRVVEILGAKNVNSLSNFLFHGDNLDVMQYLLDEGWKERFKLIYCDPPFFTGTTYRYQKISDTEQIDVLSYHDKWPGGITQYLEYLRERLKLMRELLSSHGSLWFHVGLKISHHVKLLLDEIFGHQNWLNQIVWKKTNSPKSQSRAFGNQYDIILLYAKQRSKFTLNPVFKTPTERYLKSFSKDDGDGKGPYQTVALMAGGLQKPAGRKVFEFRGVKAAWLYSKEKLEQFWKEGRIYRTKTGKYRLKVYLKDIKGQSVSDLWTDKDVSPIQGSSSEYLGFQTQKPESLLRRIIQAGSSEGDLVGDFFAGSGTTLVVAKKLGRSWVGSDISPSAIHLTRKRLLTSSMATVNDCPQMEFDLKELQESSGFALMVKRFPIRSIKKRLNHVFLMLPTAREETQLNYLVLNENESEIFIDSDGKTKTFTELLKKLEDDISRQNSSHPPLTINFYSPDWELQRVQDLQSSFESLNFKTRFWNLPTSLFTFLENPRKLNSLTNRMKEIKKDEYLNLPAIPWQMPRLKVILTFEPPLLHVAIMDFEMKDIIARNRFKHKQESFHLDYCAFQFGTHAKMDPFRADVVIFQGRSTTSITWQDLYIDLSSRPSHMKKKFIDVGIKLVDILGREVYGSARIKASEEKSIIVK